MNKVLNWFELIMLKVSRKLFHNHNEPFDLGVWLFCIACRLFRKKTIRKLKIYEAINRFASQGVIKNRRLRRKLFNDVLYSALVFGSSAEEYFFYKFDTKKYSERRKYITTFIRPFEFDQYVNERTSTWTFQNKYKTYLKFKEFYHRNIIFIESEQNYYEFCSFVKTHEKFVYKPYNSAFGNGVRLVDSTLFESLESAFNEIMKDGKCVLEEIVVQAPEMSALNPSSVNTIRIPTVLTKDGVKILYPFLRLGKNNTFVDNGGAGGILSLIDLDTGIICATPQDEDGNRYILHPETKAQIIGFKIPKWKELIELAEKIAYIMPTVRYVGWDFALSVNGWVLIEGNNGGMFAGQQMLDQIGKKQAYYSLINKI